MCRGTLLLEMRLRMVMGKYIIHARINMEPTGMLKGVKNAAALAHLGLPWTVMRQAGRHAQGNN